MQLKELAYITHLWCTLEYASTVWDPLLGKDIMKLGVATCGSLCSSRLPHTEWCHRDAAETRLVHTAGEEEKCKTDYAAQDHQLWHTNRSRTTFICPASRRTRATNKHKFKQLTANTTVCHTVLLSPFFPGIRTQDYINRVTGGSPFLTLWNRQLHMRTPPPPHTHTRCVILYTKRTASNSYRYKL